MNEASLKHSADSSPPKRMGRPPYIHPCPKRCGYQGGSYEMIFHLSQACPKNDRKSETYITQADWRAIATRKNAEIRKRRKKIEKAVAQARKRIVAALG